MIGSSLSVDGDGWEGMPLKGGTWWHLPNQHHLLRVWAAQGSPSIITQGLAMSDLSIMPCGLGFDFISLELSTLRCENIATLYFGSVSPGDVYSCASTRCHQLLTGTWINETFKRFLLAWKSLSILISALKLPLQRPIKKKKEPPYWFGAEMANAYTVI